MRKMINKMLFTVVLFVLSAAAVNAQDVAVIVNSGVSTSSLSTSDLKAIYKGEKTTWSDGSTIVVYALKKTLPATKSFLESKAGMSLPEYNQFWQQAIFTGVGTPPKEFGSDDAMVQAVSSTPGAIGYVSAGVATGSAKVIN